MAVSRGGKAITNFVHENAIHKENVEKEMRYFSIYGKYSINLQNRKRGGVDFPAGKVNSWDEPIGEGDDEPTDEVFSYAYRRSRMVPTEKYTRPQTSSQEVGWITQPLIPVDRSDRRFHHPLHMSDMTRFMEYFWTLENRQKLNEAERLPGEKRVQEKGTPTVDSG